MNDGLYGFHPETTEAARLAAVIADAAIQRERLITSSQTVTVPANTTKVKVTVVGGGGGYGQNGADIYTMGQKGTAGGTSSATVAGRKTLSATGGGYGDAGTATAPGGANAVFNGGAGGLAQLITSVLPGETISCTVGAGGANVGGGTGSGTPATGSSGAGSGGDVNGNNYSGQFYPYPYGVINGNAGAVRLEFY